MPIIRERHLLVKLESERGQEGKPACKKTCGLATHVKRDLWPKTTKRFPLPGAQELGGSGAASGQ